MMIVTRSNIFMWVEGLCNISMQKLKLIMEKKNIKFWFSVFVNIHVACNLF
jgi:hypothetical protein